MREEGVKHNEYGYAWALTIIQSEAVRQRAEV